MTNPKRLCLVNFHVVDHYLARLPTLEPNIYHYGISPSSLVFHLVSLVSLSLVPESTSDPVISASILRHLFPST